MCFISEFVSVILQKKMIRFFRWLHRNMVVKWKFRERQEPESQLDLFNPVNSKQWVDYSPSDYQGFLGGG